MLPSVAISVRQPWAWAIIHAGKDIENRSWRAGNPALHFRGAVCIHAAQGMTRAEYEDAAETINHISGIVCPRPDELLRGGIIGRAEVAEIVKDHDSPWFYGPKGLVLIDRQPAPFVPATGELGFFKWRPSETGVEPAKWMTAWGRPPPPTPIQQELL